MSYGLPSTRIACLYSVMPAAGEGAISDLEKCFTKAGYDVRARPNASLEDLRALPRNCSVFYFNTHGVFYGGSQKRRIFYALQTGTEYNGEPGYDDEIHAGLLDTAGGTDQNGHERTYITITNEFIRKYWHFADNSIVFINGCDAFDDNLGDDSIYRIILSKGCNASVYGGWTRANVSNCDFANLYLFDLLLGSDFPMARREYPPQRPFDLDTVLKKISSLGLADVLVNLEDGKQEHSILRIEPSGRGDFGILAPSIEYVNIDEEKKKLTLHGFFGTDQSKIRVFVRNGLQSSAAPSGFELTREPFSSEQVITCTGLPDSGDGSAGYLVAAAEYDDGRFIESNPVPITAWKGTFTYTLRLPDQGPDASIGRIDISAYLRGDIHRPRKVPGEVPRARPCIMGMVQDKTTPARYSSGSCYKDPKTGYSYEWHGDGTFPPAGEKPGGVAGIWGWHRYVINPANPKLFVGLCSGFEEAMVDITDKEGRKIATNLTAPINTVYLANELNSGSLLPLDFLQGSLTWEADALYEPNYDIPNPKKPLESPILYGFLSGDQKILIAKLSWETLKAQFAPDDTTYG